MDYQTLIDRLTRKGEQSFWYTLAQSAWVQTGGSAIQSHTFAKAYTTGAMAASILDDVQDQDGLRSLSQSLGSGRATNIGVALAFQALQTIGLITLPPNQQNRLMKHYIRTVEQMCRGQHRDLADCTTYPKLNDAWAIVEDKTAVWCAYGTSAYAETIETEHTPSLYKAGWHLGCWHQIGNDLTSILHDDGKSDLLNRKHTVLSAYAFTVAEGPLRMALETAWSAVEVAESLRTLRDLFLELGVTEYAAVMGNYHLNEAIRFAKEVGVSLPIPDSHSTSAYKWAPVEEPATH